LLTLFVCLACLFFLSVVAHSDDVLLGSIVGLYFPRMPPPPELKPRGAHHETAPKSDFDKPMKDIDESSEEEEDM
jgi:hypothetical protein